jgi:hypothetical protein
VKSCRLPSPRRGAARGSKGSSSTVGRGSDDHRTTWPSVVSEACFSVEYALMLRDLARDEVSVRINTRGEHTRGEHTRGELGASSYYRVSERF